MMTAGLAYGLAENLDDLTEDLRKYLLETQAHGPRENSHWVMSPEWFGECRRLSDLYAARWVQSLDFLKDRPGDADDPGVTLRHLEYLLGIPIEVREDAGAPRLEGNA